MQNILKIKEKLEDQEKQNFAMMRIRLTEEEEKLARIMEKRDRIVAEGEKLRIGAVDVLKIKENEHAQRDAEAEVKAQRLQVTMAERNLEAARIRMQEAMQERKIHEKLRENAFDNFLKEEAEAEAKEIDQLTSYTYGRKAQTEE
ncbi:MAG: flagellar export protein FliJ [Lachnospiraceae bacterium]|nr:flagellar export protein FliJ [Lachnospiraceae bacterium]